MDLGRAAVADSAGGVHCAALLDDGSVRCFGDNDVGQCDVPSGLRDVVSVECGERSTFALHADGRLSWWGRVKSAPVLNKLRAPMILPRPPMGIVVDELDGYEQPEDVDVFPATFSAGRCTAIAADSHGLLTVSADGRLVHYRYGDGGENCFARPPSGRVAWC
eukprot:TRINITY_DN7310_c0_g1_i4.p1 TRINITY_DN7310_c0_g1~~TRINITY_DN7310_c0_g1_i4.p1  ORF type:complete len:163 (+),score=36.22 TRINITY_DN7310_c0_g1_i4:3-491(+)